MDRTVRYFLRARVRAEPLLRRGLEPLEVARRLGLDLEDDFEVVCEAHRPQRGPCVLLPGWWVEPAEQAGPVRAYPAWDTDLSPWVAETHYRDETGARGPLRMWRVGLTLDVSGVPIEVEARVSQRSRSEHSRT